jgi:hypothetical protein
MSLYLWSIPYQLLNVCTNLYETWYVCRGTWAHLNGVLHKSLWSVCVSLCVPPIVARQRLGKNVTAATTTYATIKELLNESCTRSVSYQRVYAISSSQYFLFAHICFELYSLVWTMGYGLDDRGIGVRLPTRARVFVYSTPPRPAPEPTERPVQSVPGLSSGVKQRRREAAQSHSYTSTVKENKCRIILMGSHFVISLSISTQM